MATTMVQDFRAHPMVYLVLVTTKARGAVRRIDSVHEAFTTADARAKAMYLSHDELASVVAKALM